VNPLKRLAGDTAIYGLSTIVARLINYLLVAYHTRVLDRAQYGVFTEFYGYVTFFLVLLTYGMETGFFRFSSRTDRPQGAVFGTSMAALLATSTLFLALVASNIAGVSAWMGYPQGHAYVLQVAAVIAIDAFITIPFARLRFLRRARTFALFKLLNVVFYVAVSVVFFTCLPGYLAQHPESLLLRLFSATPDVGYIFTANLLSSLLSLLLLLPTILGVRVSFSLGLLKKMLRYSLPLLIAGLPGIANDYLDRILFKHLYADPAFALDQLGVYGANAKLAVLMMLFVQMFRYAAEPFFFSHADKTDARPLFAQVMKYFVACAVLLFLLVTLYMDIFVLFTGKSFREGAGIVPIMLFANLLLGVVFNLSMWYKLSEKTKYAVYITAAGMLVTVAVNLLFIPQYGYYAAAWAHLLSYAVMVLVSYLMGQKFYPIGYDLKGIGFYVLAGLCLYAVFACCGGLLAPLPRFVLSTALLALYVAVALLRDGRTILKRLKAKR
jgi:O-antigen/teichoic acid export membrane protein